MTTKENPAAGNGGADSKIADQATPGVVGLETETVNADESGARKLDPLWDATDIHEVIWSIEDPAWPGATDQYEEKILRWLSHWPDPLEARWPPTAEQIELAGTYVATEINRKADGYRAIDLWSLDWTDYERRADHYQAVADLILKLAGDARGRLVKYHRAAIGSAS